MCPAARSLSERRLMTGWDEMVRRDAAAAAAIAVSFLVERERERNGETESACFPHLSPSLPPSLCPLSLPLPTYCTHSTVSLSNPGRGRPCLFPYTCTTSLFSFSLSSIGMIIFASTSLHSRRLHKFRGGGRENDSRVIIMVALRSLAVAE